METTLVGYPHLKERLDAIGKPVYLLDLLQEVNSYVPCPILPMTATTDETPKFAM